MLQLCMAESPRSYNPETIALMTAAFERVCRSLSTHTHDNDDLRRELALAILRLVDRGERNETRLADAAFRELAGLDRALSRDRSATAMGNSGF